MKLFNELLFILLRRSFRLFNKIINKFGFVLSKPGIIHGSPAFSGSLTFRRRAFQTNQLLKLVHNIEGDIVEGGVHWGYGILIEVLLSNKHIHAFDSFAGHSKPTKQDLSSSSWIPLNSSFAVSENDAYKTLLIGSNLSKKEISRRVSFYKGWIQDTMPAWSEDMLQKGSKIAYVHADMDIYNPIKTILNTTFPLLNLGGVVCLGMLNNPELEGKRIAFNEFLESIDKSSIEIKKIDVIDTDGKSSELVYFVKLS